MITDFDIPFDLDIDANCVLLEKVNLKSIPFTVKVYIPAFMVLIKKYSKSKPKVPIRSMGYKTLVTDSECKPAFTSKTITEKYYFSFKVYDIEPIKNSVLVDSNGKEYIPAGTLFKINFSNGLINKPNLSTPDTNNMTNVDSINVEELDPEDMEDEYATNDTDDEDDTQYTETEYAEDSDAEIEQEDNGLYNNDYASNDDSDSYSVDVNSLLYPVETEYATNDTEEDIDDNTYGYIEESYEPSIPSLLFPVETEYATNDTDEDNTPTEEDIETEYATNETVDNDAIAEQDREDYKDWLPKDWTEEG